MSSIHIGFIGTGVMGKSIAQRLLRAGYTLSIFTRTYEKAEDLLKEGAIWETSVAALSQKCDVLFTMVGFPVDVEEVYFGPNGILQNAKPGSYVVDMTTSSPSLAQEIFKKAANNDLHALDAPVSGGDIGAQNGTLSIMVGGTKQAYDYIEPLFHLVGSSIVWQGEAGAGQYTKMCNQIAIASNMMGVSEAIVYAKQAGLDPDTVLKSISDGAAGSWSLSNLAPRMIQEDFSPGFYVKHFIKDMGIAITSAEELGLQLPGLQLAKQLYDKLAAEGEENSGTQALIKYYQ
ncbi:NAD(P)-dependent oxidoreductase [Pontibacillus salicampi]|uniref:NAD(P)-dependent oxidoreductase n=1 Tax=Pontibacillus salicampi TaxID=1449801 RepID=A0ABV6LQB0_9BACI